MGAGQFISPIIDSHKSLQHFFYPAGLLNAHRQKKIITIFDETLWEKVGPNGTVEHDTTNFLTGSRGLKLTTTTNSYCAARKSKAINAVKNIGIDIYVEDATKISQVGLYLVPGSAQLIDYFSLTFLGGALKNGWNRLIISGRTAYIHGNLTYQQLANITNIQIRLTPVGEDPASITVDRIYTVEPTLERGKVTITFDDGNDNIFTVSKPKMDAYGYPGVAYIPTSHIGTAGKMTLAQLKILQELGWDISSHTKTHKYLVTDAPTEDEIRTELLDSRQWLINNNFHRGSQHFALPGGEYTNEILSLTKEYYATTRTIVGGVEPYPDCAFERLKVFLLTNTTSQANIDYYINKVAVEKQWLIICLHLVLDPADAPTKILPVTFDYLLSKITAANVDVVTMSDMIQENGVGLTAFNNYALIDKTTNALSRLAVDNGAVIVETL